MRGHLKPAPGSWEQAHTEPHRGAANVEVRWNKRCVSKLAQSCRQGNRLYKSSPYLLCDFGEKEKKPESGVPGRPGPGTDGVHRTCHGMRRTPRRRHTPGAPLHRWMASPEVARKMCSGKNTRAHQPTAATRSPGDDRNDSQHRSRKCKGT